MIAIITAIKISVKIFHSWKPQKVSWDESKPRKEKTYTIKSLRCWRYKLKKIAEEETPSYVYRIVLSKSAYELSGMSVKTTNQFSIEILKNLKIHKKTKPRIFKTIQSIKTTTTRIITLNFKLY